MLVNIHYIQEIIYIFNNILGETQIKKRIGQMYVCNRGENSMKIKKCPDCNGITIDGFCPACTENDIQEDITSLIHYAIEALPKNPPKKKKKNGNLRYPLKSAASACPSADEPYV